MLYRYLIILTSLSTLLLGCDELGTKSEYQALQSVWVTERNSLVPSGEIRKLNGYIIVAFHPEYRGENIWVLLNPKHPPYYKQIPQTNFTISRKEFDAIRRIQGISETVIAVLATRISSNEGEKPSRE
jgi:hypothetical protein